MTQPPHPLPNVVRKYWYSIDWDVESLWALELPTETIPVSLLAWHMDVPVWPNEAGKTYSTTPHEVLSAPRQNRREHARILAADLSFPIEVIDRGGKLMILDGIHRLARSILEGHKSIRVRRVPATAIRHL